MFLRGQKFKTTVKLSFSLISTSPFEKLFDSKKYCSNTFLEMTTEMTVKITNVTYSNMRNTRLIFGKESILKFGDRQIKGVLG